MTNANPLIDEKSDILVKPSITEDDLTVEYYRKWWESLRDTFSKNFKMPLSKALEAENPHYATKTGYQESQNVYKGLADKDKTKRGCDTLKSFLSKNL